MKLILLLIFLFTNSACGLKITEEVDDNILLGTWNLTAISCLSSAESTIELERYVFPSTIQVKIIFSGSKITYSAVGTCSTSSVGLYSTNFNGTSTGMLDIINVITGGITCSETLTDSGLGTVGDQSITTTLDGNYSQGLNWLITNERDTLELSYYTGYNGSSTVTTCEGNCYCKAIFRK